MKSETSHVFAGTIPVLRGEEQYFFDRCREDKLVIQWCPGCETHVFYPRSVCPACWASDLEWVEAEGRGRVFTYTVQQRAPEGFEAHLPYITAMIELTEGVRIMSRVLCDPADVHIDMPVHVEFAQVQDGSGADFRVPVFTPDERTSDG